MFERPGPRLFGLAPGVDFPNALARGLLERSKSPDALARIEIYVNAPRMARRLRGAFDEGPATLLPQIRLITDLADPIIRAGLPAPVPPLRRRLELTALVSRLLQSQPGMAPRSALFDLADSLAALMEEMQTEGVMPVAINALDVSDSSGHWQRALAFLNIVQTWFGPDQPPDPAGFSRLAMQMRLIAWQEAPPDHPILVAGSTGSRGTSHEFMRAVADLPQGAVILPGFDFHMPRNVWDRLNDAMISEDHPQYRFAKLMRELDLGPGQVREWVSAPPPAPARNKVLSLALRPAPVTHQWLLEGPDLPDLQSAMADVTLLETQTTREEAQAIALRLRQAVEDGARAALITPDRMLTRQVSAALDRFGIVADDSAGIPAQLSPPGRLMRQVAALFYGDLSAESLLALLKHPLTHADEGRGPHALMTRALELHIRKVGMPYPDSEALRAFGASRDMQDWTDWLITCFCGQDQCKEQPLGTWLERHVMLAETISAGAKAQEAKSLWAQAAGRKLREMIDKLRLEAGYAPSLSAQDYAALFGAILSKEELRSPDPSHPDIRIWGTLEARTMGADLMILAGLNEGSWPQAPAADPWLNRKLRMQAGLLLPERRIGLSAHDFQQAAGAREIWLTRAVKSDDAQTVPARWLNRLSNLLKGLPEKAGPEALAAMRARGALWHAHAQDSDKPIKAQPAPRPSPAPPLAARPRQLSVTRIKHLIRDPYAIYARHVLGLRALDPLMRAPDALMRGTVLHKVMEDFARQIRDLPVPKWRETLIRTSHDIIEAPGAVPFAMTRALWLARIDRLADWLVQSEEARRQIAPPGYLETSGTCEIASLGFTLTAQADRIDIDENGGAHILDYKTGRLPSPKEQQFFDKQLLLEAAMLERGAFGDPGPRDVADARFVSLDPNNMKEQSAPLQDAPPGKVWEEFTLLISAYLSEQTGYTARRALLLEKDKGDYDHLARHGEWEVSDAPVREDLHDA